MSSQLSSSGLNTLGEFGFEILKPKLSNVKLKQHFRGVFVPELHSSALAFGKDFPGMVFECKPWQFSRNCLNYIMVTVYSIAV